MVSSQSILGYVLGATVIQDGAGVVLPEVFLRHTHPMSTRVLDIVPGEGLVPIFQVPPLPVASPVGQ